MAISGKMNAMDKIRNFCIIAHIDHGKSTLADRMLEITGTVSERESSDRMLDTLELEKEKGITIKLQTARMNYKGHILNLIDTPGHVDFSYEVSRSIAASEGALLLVDATQGIQAQTFTTVYKALEGNLEIIPVINKVDLPSAEVDKVIAEIEANFGFKRDEILLASGKTGIGVEAILDRIIEKVPAPKEATPGATQALIFDSFYHEHKGVVTLVKVASGSISQGTPLYVINSNLTVEPIELGYLKPALIPQAKINAGEVGYIATGLKDIRSIHVGDTITLETSKDTAMLPGYLAPKPMVYASVYPVDADQFPEFQEALEKLALNDAALNYQKETSQALGSGFNCGFLGLLHLEVSLERLEREFDLDLITTTPSVEYLVKLATKDYSKLSGINTANIDNDGILHIRNAAEYPDPSLVEEISEPWSKLEVVTPDSFIGGIMELVEKHRGMFQAMEYLSAQMVAGKRHVILKYEIPTAEIMTDFFDKLKSISQGFASMDYELIGHRPSQIVKVSILVNTLLVDALSFLAHRSNAETRGRKMISKLVDLIPKQQFRIPLQAAIGGQIIARETIQAFRKDVTAKLYGGDITRKKKLLEKQKKGKKRLKQFGSVEVPKSAFLAALST
jgi:GTP-binding protein LepA